MNPHTWADLPTSTRQERADQVIEALWAPDPYDAIIDGGFACYICLAEHVQKPLPQLGHTTDCAWLVARQYRRDYGMIDR